MFMEQYPGGIRGEYVVESGIPLCCVMQFSCVREFNLFLVLL